MTGPTGEGARLSAAQRTHLVSFRSQRSPFRFARCRRAQGNLLSLGNTMPQSSWGCTPYYNGQGRLLFWTSVFTPRDKRLLVAGKVSLSRNPSPGLQEELRPRAWWHSTSSLVSKLRFLKVLSPQAGPDSPEPPPWCSPRDSKVNQQKMTKNF